MPITSDLAAAERRLAEMVNRRADAEQRDLAADQRSQEMLDAEKRIALQARFEDTFQPYGERAPAPAADESVPSYHKHLLRTVQKKLSPADDRVLSGTNNTTVGDLARLPVNEMTRTLRDGFDPLFHQAASLQAEKPHVSTLPPEGEFVARHRVDEAGRSTTEFHGRESFIKGLSRPGRLVQAIHTDRGNVFFKGALP
jgi:hypothetical protein